MSTPLRKQPTISVTSSGCEHCAAPHRRSPFGNDIAVQMVSSLIQSSSETDLLCHERFVSLKQSWMAVSLTDQACRNKTLSVKMCSAAPSRRTWRSEAVKSLEQSRSSCSEIKPQSYETGTLPPPHRGQIDPNRRYRRICYRAKVVKSHVSDMPLQWTQAQRAGSVLQDLSVAPPHTPRVWFGIAAWRRQGTGLNHFGLRFCK